MQNATPLVTRVMYTQGESRNVAGLEYHPATSTVVVTYRSGPSYRYFDVTPEEWGDALDTPRIGRWVSAVLQRPGRRYERV